MTAPVPSTDPALLSMFLLDVLHYDIERIPAMLAILNRRGSGGWRWCWPHDFTQEEVTAELCALAERRLVQVLRYERATGCYVAVKEPEAAAIAREVDDLWFDLTERGVESWQAWTPPEAPFSDAFSSMAFTPVAAATPEIRSSAALADFLRTLAQDYREDPAAWRHGSVDEYLEAVAEQLDAGILPEELLTWQTIAELLQKAR